MGYEMSLKEQKFFIKKEDKEKALELLKDLLRSDNEIRWVSKRGIIDSITLEEAIEECCWVLKNDGDGNVNGISFEMEKLGDEYKIFNAIAPTVKNGSFIEMRGEDGNVWRWVFKDGKCEEVKPKIEWMEEPT